MILASFGIGVYVGSANIGATGSVTRLLHRESSQSRDVDFSVYWEVWDLLEKKFIHQPVDDRDRFYGSIKGMVGSLGDPYTAFMTPEETSRFQQDLQGVFQGIGIEIALRKDLLTVVSPLEDSPAARAGIRAGDVIIEIDGVKANTLTLDEAVDKIRGQKGTSVTLKIEREGTKTPLDFTITRESIEVASVNLEFKDNVAHLTISRFGETTTKELEDAAKEIETKKPKGIILDLRNDPGGFLQTSIDVASFFIKDGIIVVQKFGNGDKKTFKTSGEHLLANYPLVALVNEGSASAAEIVAGALRDQKGTKLIGKKTFGKGSVQDVELLSDGSSVRVTVAEWYTPKGVNLNSNGLNPDVDIDLTTKDIEAERDPQLSRALEEVVK